MTDPGKGKLQLSLGTLAFIFASSGVFVALGVAAFYFENYIGMVMASSVGVLSFFGLLAMYGGRNAAQNVQALSATKAYGKGPLIVGLVLMAIVVCGVAIVLYLKAP